jgi:hypothetical protein
MAERDTLALRCKDVDQKRMIQFSVSFFFYQVYNILLVLNLSGSSLSCVMVMPYMQNKIKLGRSMQPYKKAGILFH